jgi:hypothetical protein
MVEAKRLDNRIDRYRSYWIARVRPPPRYVVHLYVQTALSPRLTARYSSRTNRGRTLHLADIDSKSRGHHEAIGGEWIEIGAWKYISSSTSSGDTIEKKKRARIPTPPSKSTQPTSRGTANWERVQPAKAAKPSDNAQIFTAGPTRQNLRNNF